MKTRARRDLDADGLLVTPGFVDVHTHFDGQATWDTHLTPSCWHGVTTAVLGNCGVGLRAGRPQPSRMADRPHGRGGRHPRECALGRDGLRLGDVPRIPRRVGSDAARPRHRHASSSRRGARLRDGRARRRATKRRRRKISPGWPRSSPKVCGPARSDSPRAGPWATARSTVNPSRARSRPKTSCSASRPHSSDTGLGVFELAPAGTGGEAAGDAPDAHISEIDWMVRVAEATNRPVTFLVMQSHVDPERWRHQFEVSREARAERHPDLPASRVALLRHADRAPIARESVPDAAHVPNLDGPALRRPHREAA